MNNVNYQSSLKINCWIFPWLLIIFLLSAVQAQEVSMSGNITFTRNENTLTFSVPNIQNFKTTSANLELELWAVKVPFYDQGPLSDTPLNGIKLVSRPFSLEPNASLNFENENSEINQNINGHYNVVLVLRETDESLDRIVDWFNFVQIETFGNVSPFTPTVPSGGLLAEFVGTWEGQTSVTDNGSTSAYVSTMVVEKLAEDGFMSKTYIRQPGRAIIENLAWYYGNGALHGTISSNGAQESFIGNWLINERTILITTVSSHSQDTRFDFTEINKVESTVLSSSGSVEITNANKIMTSAPAPTPASTPASTPAAPSNNSGTILQKKTSSKKAGAKSKKKKTSSKKAGVKSKKKKSSSKKAGVKLKN